MLKSLGILILALPHLSTAVCGTETAVIRRGFIETSPFFVFRIPTFRGVAGLGMGEWCGRPRAAESKGRKNEKFN